ncbi:hypothetical protein GTO27_06200 [Candidatus Bathyarchaeota archaeon]|nr:hypothetical protein [Candidatus Bathyarchaeota archaeon]
MVGRRTLALLTLATLVWAVSTSSLAVYFYLQNTISSEQILENQSIFGETTSYFDESIGRYNLLHAEYSILYGDYSFPGHNLTLLMMDFGRVMAHLEGNYSSILVSQEDLNETYNRLLEDCLLHHGVNVTDEALGGLLDRYYDLFNLLALRELGQVISRSVILNINICIDYGNGTLNWHNETAMPAGSSLFQATPEIAKINYTYYQFIQPGHILLHSINDKDAVTGDSEGWNWIWYYWDRDLREWISGPIGCDAWMLRNNCSYKWKFEHWSWP